MQDCWRSLKDGESTTVEEVNCQTRTSRYREAGTAPEGVRPEERSWLRREHKQECTKMIRDYKRTLSPSVSTGPLLLLECTSYLHPNSNISNNSTLISNNYVIGNSVTRLQRTAKPVKAEPRQH
jgi:hypothetical protein